MEHISIPDIICKYCALQNKNFIEDEFHFICICELYISLRDNYIKYTHNMAKNSFYLFMETKSNFFLYIYKNK